MARRERVIRFGHQPTPDLLGGPGYTLLTTRRAAAQLTGSGRRRRRAAHRRRRARRRDRRRPAPRVTGELLVALGGGRVIDTAKALASADPPRRVAAIPTTLSGAEMTAVHRRLAGVPLDTPRSPPGDRDQRPGAVRIAAAGRSRVQRRERAAHAAEGPLTPLRNPVATLAAGEAIRLIDAGFRPADGRWPPRARARRTPRRLRDRLDRLRAAPRDVADARAVCRRRTRPGELDPASTYDRRARAALPRRSRRPDARPLAARIAELTGATRLREIDVSEEALERCADEAAARPELHLTPPPADRDELLEIYRAAW